MAALQVTTKNGSVLVSLGGNDLVLTEDMTAGDVAELVGSWALEQAKGKEQDLYPGAICWVDASEDTSTRWSPFDIRLMLHFCTNPVNRFELADAPIYEERVQALVDAELIETDRGAATHIATAKGRALVQMWCQQPIPVVRYLDPRLAAEHIRYDWVRR